ncbi:carnitine O-acyltransferase, variant [Capsaspora owczarzaki ATCC 30864]|nr:carnitine O-acyltransferase, variant [Capsaspora owczarzaki ATCC 30864]
MLSVFAAIMLADGTASEESNLYFVRSKLDWINDHLWWAEWAPTLFRVLIVSSIGAVLFFLLTSIVRRYLLRTALSWKGWMYQEPGKRSHAVTAWGLIVQVLSFSLKKPLMYSYQNALPRQSVPALKDTVARYLKTVEPLLSSEEFASVKKNAQDFVNTTGPAFQRLLLLKSWMADNYVTDWWEKYVYLRGRSSIMINSNFYVLDSNNWSPTTIQASRAGQLTYQLCQFRQLWEREQLQPLVIRDTVPLCMWQYERIFSTSRIPGKEFDEIVHYDKHESRHIIVQCRNIFYDVSLFHTDGSPFTAADFENQYEWILRDAAQSPAPAQGADRLAALTADNRGIWHDARLNHFSAGINRVSLARIDKAAFFVNLDEGAPALGEAGASDQGRALLHGNGRNRWFDKSFTLVVFSNGKAGLNTEHSWADAPVIGHMWEWAGTAETMAGSYLTSGAVDIQAADIRRAGAIGDLPSDSSIKAARVKEQLSIHLSAQRPQKLQFQFSQAAVQLLDESLVRAQAMISDFDLKILYFKEFGKSTIKKARVSPDAFIQLALQLAYFKNQGKFTQTYESSMTRLYLKGRTETVRPVTDMTCAFVRAMVDKDGKKEERVRLLQKAGDLHQQAYRDAMCGKGVDRHLFALYLVSIYKQQESKFLSDALSVPWRLSTSQQPQQQTDRWDPNAPDSWDRVCAGGGFGPVADDGYGVSYMVAGEKRLFFHVSCKRSSSNTDATEFARLISESLMEMRDLFV